MSTPEGPPKADPQPEMVTVVGGPIEWRRYADKQPPHLARCLVARVGRQLDFLYYDATKHVWHNGIGWESEPRPDDAWVLEQNVRRP